MSFDVQDPFGLGRIQGKDTNEVAGDEALELCPRER